MDSPQIIHESLLDQSMGILPFVHTVQREALHGQRFTVFGKLFEDCIGVFDSLFVLLLLIVLHHVLEQISLLFGQELALSSLGVVLGSRHDFFPSCGCCWQVGRSTCGNVCIGLDWIQLTSVGQSQWLNSRTRAGIEGGQGKGSVRSGQWLGKCVWSKVRCNAKAGVSWLVGRG